MNRLSWLVVMACAAGAMGVANAQGIGAKFGSREPATCDSKKDPVKGAPTAEQARRHFICGAEKQSGRDLWLVSDVKVEVGKGVAYRDIPQISRPGNADPEGMVYQIRGAYKSYLCSTLSSGTAPGKNCRVYDLPRATGECHKDNFAEWQCSMNDMDSPDKYGTAEQAPPRN